MCLSPGIDIFNYGGLGMRLCISPGTAIFNYVGLGIRMCLSPETAIFNYVGLGIRMCLTPHTKVGLRYSGFQKKTEDRRIIRKKTEESEASKPKLGPNTIRKKKTEDRIFR